MHNLDKNNDKIPLTDNKYDVKVFYKGQELLLKEYLEELFPEDKQSLEKAKITVQSIRNGYQTLNTRNVAEIILGKQNGKDYLRSDQRFVFGKIQERINEKDSSPERNHSPSNRQRAYPSTPEVPHNYCKKR